MRDSHHTAKSWFLHNACWYNYFPLSQTSNGKKCLVFKLAQESRQPHNKKNPQSLVSNSIQLRRHTMRVIQTTAHIASHHDAEEKLIVTRALKQHSLVGRCSSSPMSVREVLRAGKRKHLCFMPRRGGAMLVWVKFLVSRIWDCKSFPCADICLIYIKQLAYEFAE